MKTYILIFRTQNFFYQKDKWYIQCHNPNHPKKTIIMNLFLLVELETKPTTFYHHT
jgi:hypothetical protein